MLEMLFIAGGAAMLILVIVAWIVLIAINSAR